MHRPIDPALVGTFSEPGINTLVTDNIPLAKYLVRKTVRKAPPGIDYDSLLSAALLGLTCAAEGYDASRGYKFSTYASSVISTSIRHELRSHFRNIKRETKLGTVCCHQLNEEVAETFSVPGPEAGVLHKEQLELLTLILQSDYLSEIEALVVKEHFLNGKSFRKLAQELPLTAGRLQQIAVASLKKLRIRLAQLLGDDRPKAQAGLPG
jgi:RNA polymerase sigma factor (sigma-70 family)